MYVSAALRAYSWGCSPRQYEPFVLSLARTLNLWGFSATHAIPRHLDAWWSLIKRKADARECAAGQPVNRDERQIGFASEVKVAKVPNVHASACAQTNNLGAISEETAAHDCRRYYEVLLSSSIVEAYTQADPKIFFTQRGAEGLRSSRSLGNSRALFSTDSFPGCCIASPITLRWRRFNTGEHR
jgi:hypothetical protein